MPRIRCRRSARAGRTRACRTRRTSPGSSRRCSQGEAPASLIDTYEIERGQAADENIRHSTRSTDFIAPRTATERHFRNAALELAGRGRVRAALRQLGPAVDGDRLRHAAVDAGRRARSAERRGSARRCPMRRSQDRDGQARTGCCASSAGDGADACCSGTMARRAERSAGAAEALGVRRRRGRRQDIEDRAGPVGRAARCDAGGGYG